MTINTNSKLCKQHLLVAAFGCTPGGREPVNVYKTLLIQNSLCNLMQLVLDQLDNKMQKYIFQN